MSKTSFKTISYNSSTKVLTINGVDYTLASTASGESVSCGSFGEVSLTDAGVLTINGTAINLPLDLPDNLILDVNGNIIKASDGYILTTEVQTPTLISFTIENITYQAEDGMIWEDWIVSAYNTDGYISSGVAILDSSEISSVAKVDSFHSIIFVSPYNEIIANDEYFLFTPSSGGSSE